MALAFPRRTRVLPGRGSGEADHSAGEAVTRRREGIALRAVVTPEDFDAVLFDMDGVLVTSRAMHAAAWKRTFDEFLGTWDARHGTKSAPFEDRTDYAIYVDGKPRQEGVRDFLGSRAIELPEGDPGSSPEEESVW